MSDSDYVDVGDELVMKISGYPVGKVDIAKVVDTFDNGPRLQAVLRNNDGEPVYYFYLPLDVKDYDTVDGYGHHSQPLNGVQRSFDRSVEDEGYRQIYGADETGALSE